MTLQELKHLFQNSLKTIYPISEINQLFYISIYNRLKMSKVEVLLHINDEFEDVEILHVLERLKTSEPIQYIYQHAIFYDLDFKVSPDVLIPRQETEELVQMILDKNKQTHHLKILDIGTGSGAIAIALSKNLQYADVYASDFSEKALQIAHENGKQNEVQIMFLKHDILKDDISIFPDHLDVIVSNPPYIPTSISKELHSNVVLFEPHSALFVPDQDPILFYKKIAEIAYQKLKNEGQLFFETFELFHKDIIKHLEIVGFTNIQSIKDINGKNRFISAEKIVYLR